MFLDVLPVGSVLASKIGSTISDSVMYKAAIGLMGLASEYEDEDLPVLEFSGKIPPEWEQDW